MQRKQPAMPECSRSNTAHIWHVLIQSAERSPSDAKQSLMMMRTIGLLDEFASDLLIAALGLGGQ